LYKLLYSYSRVYGGSDVKLLKPKILFCVDGDDALSVIKKIKRGDYKNKDIILTKHPNIVLGIFIAAYDFGMLDCLRDKKKFKTIFYLP